MESTDRRDAASHTSYSDDMGSRVAILEEVSAHLNNQMKIMKKLMSAQINDLKKLMEKQVGEVKHMLLDKEREQHTKLSEMEKRIGSIMRSYNNLLLKSTKHSIALAQWSENDMDNSMRLREHSVVESSNSSMVQSDQPQSSPRVKISESVVADIKQSREDQLNSSGLNSSGGFFFDTDNMNSSRDLVDDNEAYIASDTREDYPESESDRISRVLDHYSEHTKKLFLYYSHIMNAVEQAGGRRSVRRAQFIRLLRDFRIALNGCTPDLLWSKILKELGICAVTSKKEEWNKNLDELQFNNALIIIAREYYSSKTNMNIAQKLEYLLLSKLIPDFDAVVQRALSVPQLKSKKSIRSRGSLPLYYTETFSPSERDDLFGSPDVSIRSSRSTDRLSLSGSRFPMNTSTNHSFSLSPGPKIRSRPSSHMERSLSTGRSSSTSRDLAMLLDSSAISDLEQITERSAAVEQLLKKNRKGLKAVFDQYSKLARNLDIAQNQPLGITLSALLDWAKNTGLLPLISRSCISEVFSMRAQDSKKGVLSFEKFEDVVVEISDRIYGGRLFAESFPTPESRLQKLFTKMFVLSKS